MNQPVILCPQCSKRGGELTMELRDDGMVRLMGQAVVVFGAQLSVPPW